MKKIILILVFISISFGINLNNVTENKCFRKRVYPFPEKVLFNGLKDTFLKSNINIKNASSKDGFLQGNGVLANGDELYSIIITASIKKVNKGTQITTIISYSKSKKEAELQTAGVAGVNFPIAVPWRKKYIFQDSGNITDPLFFMRFYMNLEKTIYENLMLDNSNLYNDNNIVKESTSEETKKTENNTTSKEEMDFIE